MILGIMQPYFFPYIGYFQLINAVDEFVVYDNVQYTKKGWINRNRYLVNGKDALMTLPIKKDSDFLDIKDRQLADSFNEEAEKLVRQISAAYKKAPHFEETFPIFSSCLGYSNHNLFDFILNSIVSINEYLEVNTKIVVSSSLGENRNLKSQDRVLAICDKLKAERYINAIGGLELYDRDAFQDHSVKLSFLKTGNITYNQDSSSSFVPHLSILDVMMYNSREDIKKLLLDYELV